MRKIIYILLALAIIVSLFANAALADWSSPSANQALYEAQYAEQIDSFTRLRYGSESAVVKRVKQQLSDLGFFTGRIDENYGKTLVKASAVFCQQMRITGGGNEISQLVQAMLADPSSMPRAISPGINIYEYSRSGDQSAYAPYNYAQMTTKNKQAQANVGFSGSVVNIVNVGSVQYMILKMLTDEQIVYVTYQPLPRTTRFQVGDTVAVLGETNGFGSLEPEGFAQERLCVTAVRVGYK
ncbi:MAG: hypothetical protein LBD16_03790 [Oscillospiraceae bacterium]|jgi:peptidoglycan hydrolase-like protein with peptidoglycan-binding domain|nr:hypothetical protein [Oscillospiraceae bacterium]